MLKKNIIREFIERFVTLNEKRADVQIRHLLYGNQKINKCILHPIADGERIGLIINDEVKYVSMDELRDVYIDDETCYIKSEIMELFIRL